MGLARTCFISWCEAGDLSRSLEKPSLGFWKRLGGFRRLFIRSHLLNVFLRGLSLSALREPVPHRDPLAEEVPLMGTFCSSMSPVPYGSI